jgi:hypothetical protein
MTNMQFPCEMETIDTIPVPKSIESSPVRLNRKPRPRLKKQDLDLEDVEFQQPYLIPTSEIPFNGANLRNTHWAGTCLNAVSKITGQVESRQIRHPASGSSSLHSETAGFDENPPTHWIKHF